MNSFLLDFLNALFADTAGMRVMSVEMVEVSDCGCVADVRTATGESLHVSIEFMARAQYAEWSPAHWQADWRRRRQGADVRDVGARGAVRRCVFVQIVSFICTKSEHPHSVYRFFDGRSGRGRSPELEVHLLELPKRSLLRWDEQEQLVGQPLYVMLDQLQAQLAGQLR